MPLNLADEGARDFLALVKLARENEDELAGKLIGSFTPSELMYALAAGGAMLAQLLDLVLGSAGADQWLAEQLDKYARQ